MPKLYVVATPIGNLNDVTPRMREALADVDLVAAEDTRVTGKLLSHFGISKPAVSCHRHNEEVRSSAIIERMLVENIDVALTCDAGTPAISDPGHELVSAAWDAGIEVVPISGPSATVTALSACGYDAREFAFFGFLPREKKPLCDKLKAIGRSAIPVCVIYESPHRIVKLVSAICETLPQADLTVCSDLTKYYEKIYRGTCVEVLDQLKDNPNVEKGEYCLVMRLPPAEPAREQPTLTCELVMLKAVYDGMTVAEAADLARERGYPRNEIYRVRLRLNDLIAES
ncbi:MAG: 16S rRNA (cytidine(1402)-2'-O)-methyltransferase [Clostridia bacterium]|nr:16S rRNA (cytidine(1402)-2'-O)-methyltransferase [Clostridia bacterium]